MANNCINGINWSSMRKFASFLFGEIKNHRIVDKHYFIYIDKDVYNNKKELIEMFEDAFMVHIKPDII